MNTIFVVTICLAIGFILGIARERFRNSQSIPTWHDELRRLHEQRSATSIILNDMVNVIYQTGEMLDHVGVAIEYIQEGEDLKVLGNILRTFWQRNVNPTNLQEYQEVVDEMAKRYGVLPNRDGTYSLRDFIRVAEEIIEQRIKTVMEMQKTTSMTPPPSGTGLLDKVGFCSKTQGAIPISINQ